MGSRVLNVTSVNRDHIKAYAHCTQGSKKGKKSDSGTWGEGRLRVRCVGRDPETCGDSMETLWGS
eukprot:1215781-Amorphochlora_amoeboformis.AAC.1